VVRFTTASISNGTLQVTGPAEGDPGMEVKQIRFTVAQGDAMVEDDASVSGSGWSGQTAAGDLKPGAAVGIGLAVMFKADAPAGYETRTWVEPITLT
jgi:hypothetical protein